MLEMLGFFFFFFSIHAHRMLIAWNPAIRHCVSDSHLADVQDELNTANMGGTLQSSCTSCLCCVQESLDLDEITFYSTNVLPDVKAEHPQ